MNLTQNALDLPTSTLKHAFSGLGEDLTCGMCLHSLAIRIKTLVQQWSVVKVCIYVMFLKLDNSSFVFPSVQYNNMMILLSTSSVILHMQPLWFL